MASTKGNKNPMPKVQCVNIDLPGETVQCWRSSEKIQVVLRKHRDVIFEINIQNGEHYTVESKGEFYCPMHKKLLKKRKFLDGDRCHIWVSREFKDKLVLTSNGRVIGTYEVNQLDTTNYGSDPKTKPEPLMVIMGKKEVADPFFCTPGDLSESVERQSKIMSNYEPTLSVLKGLGTKFDYTYLYQSADVKEYVAVTEASADDIQPHILTKLQKGDAVEGTPGQIFRAPNNEKKSIIYTALFAAAGYISGSEFLTHNIVKESAGYFIENFKRLDQILMKVRIEPKVKGNYQVALKGYLVSKVFGKLTGTVKELKPSHVNVPLGSENARFISGGYGRTGKAGYGGFKRIMMTSAENFRSGMKIQAVGTVIDLIVDVNTVYFDEKGSRDLSEFLGRAGISITKAGVTAALGSLFAAGGTALVTAAAVAMGAAAAPVVAVVAVVVGGYILAAYIVDYSDNNLGIKKTAAEMAR